MSQKTSQECLKEIIDEWKAKSKTNSQYDRIKRMIFAFGKKPNEFKPSDFFPQIPESLLESESEERTIENRSKNIRKSLSKRKLDYQTETEQILQEIETPETNESEHQNDNEYENNKQIENQTTIQNKTKSILQKDKTISSSSGKENETIAHTTRRSVAFQNLTNQQQSPITTSLSRTSNNTNKTISKLNRENSIKLINENEPKTSNDQINENEQEIDDDDVFDEEFLTKNNIKSIKNKLSSTINNNNLVSPVVSLKTPGKLAFDNSIKKKSNNLSFLAKDVEKMNESPLGDDNDEIVVGSGELYEAIQSVNSNKTEQTINKTNKVDVKESESENQNISSAPVTRSKITVTKRTPQKNTQPNEPQSSQPKINEPIKEIQINLTRISHNNIKQLVKQDKTIAKSKLNETQDETEMIALQSNNFIRKSLNSNKTVNSTVNSTHSSANQSSALFKPSKSTKSIPNLPLPPLFDENNEKQKQKIKKPKQRSKHIPEPLSTDDSYDEETKIKYRKVLKEKKTTSSQTNTTTKQLSQVQTSEPVQDLIEIQTQTNNVDQVEPVFEPVFENIIDSQPLEIHHEPIQTAEKDTTKIAPIFNKSQSKSKPTIYEDVAKETNSNSKSLKKSSSKTKAQREPLKDKSNEIEQKQKTSSRSSSQNKQKRVRKAKIDTNHEKIRPVNKPIFEENHQTDDEDLPLALRRSKRAKLDKNSMPVYEYETVQDYNGNKIIVKKLVGQKDKFDYKFQDAFQLLLKKPNKQTNRKKKSDDYDSEIESPIKIKKAETNKKSSKSKKDDKHKQTKLDFTKTKDKNGDRKKEKQIEKEMIVDVNNNSEPVVLDQVNDVNDNIFDQQNDPEPVLIQNDLHTQINTDKSQIENEESKNNNTLSVTINEKTNVNKTQECIYVKDDNNDPIPLNLYCFANLVEKKQYEICSKGVGISVMNNFDGVLKIDSESSTKTNNHESAIIYMVQRGTCVFSINGALSIHNYSDVVKIPPKYSYKIKNISKEDHLYLYFKFDKN